MSLIAVKDAVVYLHHLLKPPSQKPAIARPWGASLREPLNDLIIQKFSARNMEVGRFGYIAPWAVYFAKGRYFIRCDFVVFNAPGGRVKIKIKRFSKDACGFRIYDNSIMNTIMPGTYDELDLQCLIMKNPG
ncbi:MAG: hypothetical protein WC459_04390 [Patescibacteria group bacterium]